MRVTIEAVHPIQDAVRRGDDVDVGSAAHSPQQRGEWSWPPEAPWHADEGARYATEEWAPPSSVRHPWVRVGRWTLLYRRGAA